MNNYFEERIEMIPECGCWVWTGSASRNGYGRISSKLAHRISWELHNGPIPEGMFVCHHCDTPLCVNPHHLFLGTQADNIKDMKGKGRGVEGEKQGSSKLTADQVIDIRNDIRKTTAIAKYYGVTHGTISMIKSRKIWRHI